ETKKLIENVQKKLFSVGSIIAGYKNTITRDDVDFVEKEIKKIEKKLTPINDFVMPSGELSSLLHICRVKCREVERSVVSLHKKSKLPAELIAFINRLSDLFFVLSRFYENK
ncbi:MAG: ATP:cob(I)alamin adenosyltransferase, partial [Candidatus Aenigmarchaeota archaeon]|nr:ATP:cob(I)alamin adenosyltransferase [Candidatus Aenigmarchaeota archaeon]